MYSNISLQRQATLKSIVDLLVGVEDHIEVIEENDPIIDDTFIADFADNMPVDKNWSPLLAENCILNAIDAYNQVFTRFGIQEKVFSKEELAFMKDDFLRRFKKGLKKYSRGMRLVEKVFDSNTVGYRWEA